MIDDLTQPHIVDDRAALRREWDADDRQLIVWIMADYPQAADAAAGLVAVGLAAETGRPFRMLVHPQATGVDRAQRVMNAMGCPQRLIVDDRVAQPWWIVRAVDIALAMGEHCQRAMMWAMAAGLPIVADHAAAKGVLEHDRSALVGEAGRPRTLSSALIRLADDPAMARRLGNAAKSTASKPSA